ncbi:MAG: Crp/Fnr family transcriptional regulator, partial [Wenzhouxiangellaceae bacterium]|nr:Crp/Fnr family transcriptional regulator [Wenzhouxiangellaceae bacterium]
LKLYRMTRSGDEKIYEVVTADREVIASIALKPARRHSIECAAIRACDVLSTDAGLLIAAIDRSPAARARLRAMLCDHVERLVDHVELLSADRAELRVACYLLDAFRDNGSRGTFRLPSTKRQIASYLSLQPETLSRCLKSLRQAGILRSRAREIEILDAARLEAMVDGSGRLDQGG